MSQPQDARGRYPKTINDPIHGHFQVPSYCMDIIDTPQFQRLRDLKQLGAAYYIWPGAAHNRFEHSLGVSHMAGRLMERVKKHQLNLRLEAHDVKCVEIAGLIHDLGHGAFSHVWENEFIPRVRPDLVGVWNHEDMSRKLFDLLMTENHLDLQLDDDDLQLIGALVIGDRPAPRDRRKNFMFDIVSNQRNSVDVDKFDYLARDCYSMGLKSSYDCTRLMEFNKVLCVDGQWELCFAAKEVLNVYELFHTRFTLHKQVYSHRVCKAIEYMLTDALVEADPFMQLSKKLEDPDEYWKITDGVVKEIECSKAPELATSRAIIRRVRRRDLYKHVDEILLPRDHPLRTAEIATIQQDIANYQPPGSQLHSNDLIIHRARFDYTMKDRNPVDHIHFFANWNDDTPFRIEKDRVSFLIPDHFEEVALRLFCKNPQILHNARDAFKAFLKAHHLGDPLPFSPSKKARPTLPTNVTPVKRRLDDPL